MCGPSISSPSLTLGFLGFGRISQQTLHRLLAFTSKSHPPKVVYLSSRARPDQADIDKKWSKEFGVSVQRKEKEDIAAESDILVVLCNQTPDTVNLVNRDFLKRMKKSAVLINGARVSRSDSEAIVRLIKQGPIVNSEDLTEALNAGEIFGAGLDVITGEPNIGPDHPLVKAKNCQY